MKKILTLLFIGLLFNACLTNRNENIKTLDGKNLEFFLAKNNTNYDINLKNENKILLINFFASDCGACKEEIPALNEINNELSEYVKVIGVMGGARKQEDAYKFVNDFNINYSVISNPRSVNILSGAVGRVNGVPATFIFDRNGKLLEKFLGYVPKSTIIKVLKKNI